MSADFREGQGGLSNDGGRIKAVFIVQMEPQRADQVGIVAVFASHDFRLAEGREGDGREQTVYRLPDGVCGLRAGADVLTLMKSEGRSESSPAAVVIDVNDAYYVLYAPLIALPITYRPSIGLFIL